MRKFLYDGRLTSSTIDSDLALALHQHVKIEAHGVDAGIRESSVTDISKCILMEARSTPIKPKLHDCIVVGSVTATEVAESKKRRKNYDQNSYFQDLWVAKLL